MRYLDMNGLEHLTKVLVALINEKVDKEQGKGLSERSFTSEEKKKLSNVENGANLVTRIGQLENDLELTTKEEKNQLMKEIKAIEQELESLEIPEQVDLEPIMNSLDMLKREKLDRRVYESQIVELENSLEELQKNVANIKVIPRKTLSPINNEIYIQEHAKDPLTMEANRLSEEITQEGNLFSIKGKGEYVNLELFVLSGESMVELNFSNPGGYYSYSIHHTDKERYDSGWKREGFNASHKIKQGDRIIVSTNNNLIFYYKVKENEKSEELYFQGKPVSREYDDTEIKKSLSEIEQKVEKKAESKDLDSTNQKLKELKLSEIEIDIEFPKGEPGKDGERGPKGEPGKDGEDATVTLKNIKNALGYTPANKEEVDNLKQSGTERNKELVDALSSKDIVASTSDSLKQNIAKIYEIECSNGSSNNAIEQPKSNEKINKYIIYTEQMKDVWEKAAEKGRSIQLEGAYFAEPIGFGLEHAKIFNGRVKSPSDSQSQVTEVEKDGDYIKVKFNYYRGMTQYMSPGANLFLKFVFINNNFLFTISHYHELALQGTNKDGVPFSLSFFSDGEEKVIENAGYYSGELTGTRPHPGLKIAGEFGLHKKVFEFLEVGEPNPLVLMYGNNGTLY